MGAIAMRIRTRRARPAAQQMLDLIRRQGNGGAAFLPGVPLASGAHWLSGASSSPTPSALGLDGITRATVPWLAAYVESTASTPAAVDGPVGFLSDGGGGTVGAALTVQLVNPNQGAVTDLGGGIYKFTFNPASVDPFVEFRYETGAAVTGKSFSLIGEVWTDAGQPTDLTFFSYATPSISDVQAPVFTLTTAAKKYSYISKFPFATDTGFSVRYDAKEQTAGGYFYYRLPVVQQLNGRHAIQNSAPNKPLLRRGLVNLLQNSSNLTASPWQQFNAAGSLIAISGSSGAGYSTIGLASNERIQQAQPSSAGQTRTLFMLLSGAGSVYLNMTDEGGSYPGTSGLPFALTPTPTLYSLTRTHTDAAATYISGRIYATGGAAATVTVSGSAMFSGAVTAAQVAAAGGIPPTTSVGASSSSGGYALEFDGTRYMALGSVPFSASDDHAVVVGARVDDVSGNRTLYSHSNVSNHQLPWIYFGTNGKVNAVFWDGTTTVTLTSPQAYLGQDVVIGFRRVGSNAVLRINGVQVVSASLAAIASPALTTATLGGFNGPNLVHKGRIHGALSFKGTFGDAEMLVFERGLAALCPIPSLRF